MHRDRSASKLSLERTSGCCFVGIRSTTPCRYSSQTGPTPSATIQGLRSKLGARFSNARWPRDCACCRATCAGRACTFTKRTDASFRRLKPDLLDLLDVAQRLDHRRPHDIAAVLLRILHDTA